MFLELLEKDFKDAPKEISFYGMLNLFYLLKTKKSRVKISYSDLIYSGTIVQANDDNLQLVIPNFQERQERKITLHFEVLNKYYFLQTTLLKSNLDGVYIRFPKIIKYLKRRMHPRLKFDDLFMRFIILYSPILNSKKEEQAIENKYPFFMQEILNDNPSTNIIYQLLISEIKKITNSFEIVMTYNKKKEELSFLEQQVLKENKSFYIEDVSKIESYIEPYANDKLNNYAKIYHEMAIEESEQEAIAKIEKIKKTDSRNFFVSYLMTPIKMFEKTIGYIRLETNQFDRHWITPIQADEFHTFVELFSYAITKIKIRKSHFDSGSSMTKIHNISMSGCLMEINDKILYKYLQKHRRIKMLIPVYERELEIYGEIIRFFPQDGAYYLGILFFKSKPDDMIRLKQFIYDNSFYNFF